MSKFVRTAAIVVGVAALAVVTYGAAIGPTAAGLAGSAGIAGLSVSTLGTTLGLAAAGLSLAGNVLTNTPKACSAAPRPRSRLTARGNSMSVANIIVQGQRAHLLTDSGYFAADGRLVRLSCKVLEMRSLPAAMSALGSLTPAELGREVEAAKLRTVDDLLAALPEIVGAAAMINCHPTDQRHTVHLIYYSRRLGRAAGAFLATDPADLPPGFDPYAVIPVSELFGPGRDPGAVLGRSVDTSDLASFDAERDGLAIVEDQRRVPFVLMRGKAAVQVAGEVRLTTVSPTGVTTRAIGGWPDKIGKLVAA